VYGNHQKVMQVTDLNRGRMTLFFIFTIQQMQKTQNSNTANLKDAASHEQ
jgi:hypothetical protein